jgi:hypothetical protein
MEAAIGFEPMNNGFADRCLSHLAMPPKNKIQTGLTGLTGYFRNQKPASEQQIQEILSIL